MLREQQIESSRSRAILESVADGVLVTDASMKINLLNASAERILGLRVAEGLDQSLGAFIGLFGKAGQVWWETIQRWSQESGSYQPGETYAEQINLDNGRVVAVNLAPVFFRNEFLATVSIFRDITQEVQVDRLKSEFVANVSHELRTPMTSIKGYVEIMLMGAAGELNPQQKQFLTTVKANTERLNVLVNDLLDVSKIEAGRVTISLQPLDLAQIAAEVVSDVQGRSRQEGKPIAFDTDIPGDLPVVMGDAVRIRQVLANLVSNSFLYTPDGGQVMIRIRPVDHEVQIDVQDNGIGIEPRVQNRIFERFYRGEDPLVLASAGTGLGLAISKILVEMHRGKIWFYSSGVRGEGSLFSFTLPVRQDEV
jgi:PAS domain S-box-containing protein